MLRLQAMRCLLVALALLGTPAASQETGLELVLLADVSGSIDSEEFLLQRQGYAEAITDPDVLTAITGASFGTVALTYVEWANGHSVVVDWSLIGSPEDAEAFAKTLLEAPRRATGRNAIGSALLAGLAMMEDNAYDGWRWVIDFSGDSINNYSGPGIESARQTVLDAGVTINGLPILQREDPGDGAGLEAAYAERIIGGPGAFTVPAETRAAFADAIRRKLILEISGMGVMIAAR